MFLVSIPLSVVIGGPLAGAVLGNLHQVGGMAGWQWLFIIEGVVSVGLAPALLMILPNSVKDAKWLNLAEKRTVALEVLKVNAQAESTTWESMYKLPKTYYLTAIYFLMLCGNYGVVFWMPQIIKSTGIANPMTVGWLSALPYLAAMVCMPLVSRLSDSAADRSRYLVVCGVLAAAGLSIAAFWIKDTTLALVGLSMAAAGILSSVPVFWALAARCYVGSAAVVGFAIINSIGNLGGFVSPYAIGLITDATGSQLAGLYTLSGMEVAAVLMLVTLIRVPREVRT
jgi:nitrate/nitrite transporter NarK